MKNKGTIWIMVFALREEVLHAINKISAEYRRPRKKQKKCWNACSSIQQHHHLVMIVPLNGLPKGQIISLS